MNLNNRWIPLGSFTLTLTPRSHAMLRVQALEQVSISFELGGGTVGANCSLSHSSGGQGAGGMRDREKEERASGSWAWEPKEKVQSHFYVPRDAVPMPRAGYLTREM